MRSFYNVVIDCLLQGFRLPDVVELPLQATGVMLTPPRHYPGPESNPAVGLGLDSHGTALSPRTRMLKICAGSRTYQHVRR